MNSAAVPLPVRVRSIPGSMAARTRRALPWLALPLLAACASTRPIVPAEPAPPLTQLRVAPKSGDLVAYRDIAREDFLATHPPAGADRARGHVAAATCAYLVPDPQLRFRAVRRRGQELFEAEVVGLAFGARMDRECSWWDPKNRFPPDEYVLEHEQIHFALIELTARELNRQSDEIAERIRSSGETGAAALAEIQRKFKLELEEGARRAAARTAEFDRETSLGFRPEAQAQWAERVARELAESEPASTTPDTTQRP